MKQKAACFGLILSLCMPLLALGQKLKQFDQRVTQLSSNLERTIKGKEKSWTLEKNEFYDKSNLQNWRSGKQQVELQVFVYDSEAEASRMLVSHGARSVSYSQELKGFGGDEARYIDYPYFTWVGVRRGTVVMVAQGPAKDLAVTKRFVRHALNEVEKK